MPQEIDFPRGLPILCRPLSYRPLTPRSSPGPGGSREPQGPGLRCVCSASRPPCPGTLAPWHALADQGTLAGEIRGGQKDARKGKGQVRDPRMESARKSDATQDQRESCHVGSSPEVGAPADPEERGRGGPGAAPAKPRGLGSSAPTWTEIGGPGRAPEAVRLRAQGK